MTKHPEGAVRCAGYVRVFQTDQSSCDIPLTEHDNLQIAVQELKPRFFHCIGLFGELVTICVPMITTFIAYTPESLELLDIDEQLYAEAKREAQLRGDD